MTMKTTTIKASDIKVGDYIFNSLAKGKLEKQFRWVRVKQITPTVVPVTFEDFSEGTMPGVEIVTSAFTTFFLNNEGVAIQRFTTPGA